jgi:hypothetical protein
MGFFGRLTSLAGAGLHKFVQIGNQGLKIFGAIKSGYNNINNATSGILGRAIESIPGIGNLLKNVGQVLDKKETFKTLESVLNRSTVYGKDLEKIGNRLS